MPRKKKIENMNQNLETFNNNETVQEESVTENDVNETNISFQIENENGTNDIINTNITDKPKLKRGRKSKKELLLINNSTSTSTSNNIIDNNVLINELNNENNIIIMNSEVIDGSEEIQQVKSVAKKRGRKPKGGKIIQQMSNVTNVKETKSNIILHLKCHLKDLRNNVFSNNINGYDLMSNKNELYEIISNNENYLINTKNVNTSDFNNDNIFFNIDPMTNNGNQVNNQYDDEYTKNSSNDEDNFKSNKSNELRDLWKKIKNLQHNLHVNNVNDKKSACFWCTYEFDNPPIYIPKHYIKKSYHVYGCFCSPECATGYLMEENIDSSTKFERYHLLNNIYSKIYDYKKNIKPAPKPYYMLEKFYGNLNIQEYRSLLKNERLFLVVDKPLTRILPELHEDNDDFIINNKMISSNTYHIKKKLLQKQTKNNILSEKFGLQQN
jgi:hypothetical protein